MFDFLPYWDYKVFSQRSLNKYLSSTWQARNYGYSRNKVRGGTDNKTINTSMTQKQVVCPSVDEWTKKTCVCTHACVCVYRGILLSHKKESNLAIYNMDGPWRHHAKWDESEKHEYPMISLICGIWKNKQMKQTQAHRYREQIRLMVTTGRGAAWAEWVKGSQGTNFQFYRVSKSRGCHIQHGD